MIFKKKERRKHRTQEVTDPTQEKKRASRLRVKRDPKIMGVHQTGHNRQRLCWLQSTQDASCYWTLFLTRRENAQVSWSRFSPVLVYLTVCWWSACSPLPSMPTKVFCLDLLLRARARPCWRTSNQKQAAVHSSSLADHSSTSPKHSPGRCHRTCPLTPPEGAPVNSLRNPTSDCDPETVWFTFWELFSNRGSNVTLSLHN